MLKWELNDFVADLCHYFGKRIPSEDQTNAWFAKVEAIPATCLKQVKQDLESKDDFPKNLPRTLWAEYYQWMRDNPREAGEDKRTCANPWCEKGLLHVRPVEGPGVYCFRCPTCRRSDDVGIPELTKLDGWVIDRLDDVSKYVVPPKVKHKRKLIDEDEVLRIEVELNSKRAFVSEDGSGW